jgi:hypothetical protein
MNRYPPTYEQIRDLGVSSQNTAFAKPETFQKLLSLLPTLSNEGVYVFVGNGMRGYEVVFRTLFEDFPEIASRFRYVEFSRNILKADIDQSRFNDYFDSLGFDKLKSERIFVIDSTVSGENNEHAVQRAAIRLRRYLSDKGVEALAAARQVVPVAIPERKANYGSYDYFDLATYDAALEKNNRSLLKQVANETFVPWLKADVDWQTLAEFYVASRWSGKFVDFDETGRPTSGKDPLEALFNARSSSLPQYQEIVAQRTEYLNYYSTLVVVARQMKQRFGREIERFRTAVGSNFPGGEIRPASTGGSKDNAKRTTGDLNERLAALKEIDRLIQADARSAAFLIRSLVQNLPATADLGATLTGNGQKMLEFWRLTKPKFLVEKLAVEFFDEMAVARKSAKLSPFDLLVLTKEILNEGQLSLILANKMLDFAAKSQAFGYILTQSYEFAREGNANYTQLLETMNTLRSCQSLLARARAGGL